MICASCGLDNDPSATFCARCNTTLPQRPPTPAPPTERPPAGPGAQPGPSPSTGEATYPIYPRRRSTRLPLIAAGAVALLLVVVIGIVLAGRPDSPDDTVADPGPAVETTEPYTSTTEPYTSTTEPYPSPSPTESPSPAPTASAQEQAGVVDNLLDRSVASRSKLNKAIQKVQNCGDVDGALADMREVGTERNQQISEINAADLSALDNGESLRSALSTALGHSLDADQHFVAWAQPAATGNCAETGSRSAAWDRGQSSSQLAQAAKKQFLAAWNPVAVPFGYPKRTNKDI
jgi:hypothetical protein